MVDRRDSGLLGGNGRCEVGGVVDDQVRLPVAHELAELFDLRRRFDRPEHVREEEGAAFLQRQRQVLSLERLEPRPALGVVDAGGEKGEAGRFDVLLEIGRRGEGDLVPGLGECARERHQRVEVAEPGDAAEENSTGQGYDRARRLRAQQPGRSGLASATLERREEPAELVEVRAKVVHAAKCACDRAQRARGITVELGQPLLQAL